MNAIKYFSSGLPGHLARVLIFPLVALFTAVSLAQAPPGVEPSIGFPKVGVIFSQLVGGADGGNGSHVQLSGSFTVNKATGRGTLTVTAVIDPDWHIYSLTQPDGGPGKPDLKLTKPPSYEMPGMF